MAYCLCGCGELTAIAKKTSLRNGTLKGKPGRYVHGHNARGQRGEAAPGWHGGKRRVQGYIAVFMPGHPAAQVHGYVFEHRLLMESILGRFLDPSEYVHHINHVRDDNRAENLALMSKSQHSSHHTTDLWRSGRMKPQRRQLAPSSVSAIRERYFKGETIRELCVSFSIGETTARRVVHHKDAYSR